ncbi:hypothetical protein BH18ACT14_BH18ACT14_01690 [soil metagenome]
MARNRGLKARLRVPDQLVWVRHRLDRVLCRLQRGLRDEDLGRSVVKRGRMVLDCGLQLRFDPG